MHILFLIVHTCEINLQNIMAYNQYLINKPENLTDFAHISVSLHILFKHEKQLIR